VAVPLQDGGGPGTSLLQQRAGSEPTAVTKKPWRPDLAKDFMKGGAAKTKGWSIRGESLVGPLIHNIRSKLDPNIGRKMERFSLPITQNGGIQRAIGSDNSSKGTGVPFGPF